MAEAQSFCEGAQYDPATVFEQGPIELGVEQGLKFQESTAAAADAMLLDWHPSLRFRVREYAKFLQQSVFATRDLLELWAEYRLPDLTTTATDLAAATGAAALALRTHLQMQWEQSKPREGGLPGHVDTLQAQVADLETFEKDLMRFKLALSRGLELAQLLPSPQWRDRFAAIRDRLSTDPAAYAEAKALGNEVAVACRCSGGVPCAVRALCEKLAVLNHRDFGKFRRLKGRH